MDEILSAAGIEALVQQLRHGSAAPGDGEAGPRRMRFPAPEEIRRVELNTVRERLGLCAKAMERALSESLGAPLRLEIVEVLAVTRRAFREAALGSIVLPFVAPEPSPATGYLV